jgi:hypothetical protein
MSVKSILVEAGILFFVVLTIQKPAFGLAEISPQLRLKRNVAAVIAALLILIGAHLKWSLQPDVGRQFKKLIGAEHWVGGILEFARLWSEQDPYPLKRVSERGCWSCFLANS